MSEFWNEVYFGNSLFHWIVAIGIIVAGYALIRLFKKGLLNKIKRWTASTKSDLDDIVVESFDRFVIPFLYLLVLYLVLRGLHFPEPVDNAIGIAMMLVTTVFILRIVGAAIRYGINTYLGRQDNGELRRKQGRGIVIILQIVIWTGGIAFLLDNLGYNVTTIIAGLGIGGIAIALAAQAVLGDLFSYFVILFDRPFEIGDFIIVDDKMGVVEYIGLKTTRLRNLAGEQLICSNKDLTDSRVHNFKRMEKRRVVFKLGVTYQTSTGALRKIPSLVKDIISSQQEVTFDRAHFSGFGDFSLDFEIVYFILSSDYNKYMDIQQSVSFAILESFAKEGIEFAYPTQTLIVDNGGSQKYTHAALS